MKRHWLTALIIVVVVILLLFLAFAFTGKRQQAPQTNPNYNPFSDSIATTDQNQVTSPATFSINFYKWYIGNVKANISFPSTTQLETEFPAWTTSNFILHYQSTESDPNTDADPILFAQDDPTQWGSNMSAKILTETDTSSAVQVVIGSGSLAHTYVVSLIKSNNQWLIDSISGTY
jgi:hypothetical protein